MEPHQVITTAIASAALGISVWNLLHNLRKDSERLRLSIKPTPDPGVVVVTNIGSIPVTLESLYLFTLTPEGRQDYFAFRGPKDPILPLTIPPKQNQRFSLRADIVLACQRNLGLLQAVTATGVTISFVMDRRPPFSLRGGPPAIPAGTGSGGAG